MVVPCNQQHSQHSNDHGCWSLKSLDMLTLYKNRLLLLLMQCQGVVLLESSQNTWFWEYQCTVHVHVWLLPSDSISWKYVQSNFLLFIFYVFIRGVRNLMNMPVFIF